MRGGLTVLITFPELLMMVTNSVAGILSVDVVLGGWSVVRLGFRGWAFKP